MDDPDIIFADPWLKKAEKTTSLPDDARFACSYELDLVVDGFGEATFLRRADTTDELWVGIKDFSGEELSHIGCVFAVPRKGEDLTACVKLMELFFRARHGFARPGGFVAPGIVDKFAFDSLVRRIENELEENRQKARSRETEIIKAARELGLSPKPSGEGPSHWYALCPGANHPLFINAEENSFGCRWCKRKGVVEELRAFVEERKDRRIG